MQYESIKSAAEKYSNLIKPPFDTLTERIGIDNLFVLIEEYGGSMIYIPTKKTLFKNCFVKAILSEFDGKNYKHLAGKYDYSIKGIRNLLKSC